MYTYFPNYSRSFSGLQTELEERLPKLKYEGSGWYFLGQDTILILISENSPLLSVYTWSNFSPRDILEQLLKLPIYEPFNSNI